MILSRVFCVVIIIVTVAVFRRGAPIEVWASGSSGKRHLLTKHDLSEFFQSLYCVFGVRDSVGGRACCSIYSGEMLMHLFLFVFLVAENSSQNDVEESFSVHVVSTSVCVYWWWICACSDEVFSGGLRESSSAHDLRGPVPCNLGFFYSRKRPDFKITVLAI